MSMEELAAAALPRFGLSPEATAELCNVSENHTYRVDDPQTGRRYALRVHRPGYRTARQIESELDWLDALRGDGAVDTCVPVRSPDGARVIPVAAQRVEPLELGSDLSPGPVAGTVEPQRIAAPRP